MQLIIIITFLLTYFGIYLILTDHFKPTDRRMKKTARAFQQFYKNDNSDEFIEALAFRLSKYVHINSYKRRKMEADLNSLGITMSPEIHKATILVKSGFIVVFGMISLLFYSITSIIIFPIICIVLFATAFILYFKFDSDIREKLQKKKEEIEYEMPRFACTLNQELKASKDVLNILTSYKKNSGKSLREELEITVADMRSGNYEAALTRFEGRLSIATLSDIVRGLIGVLRGDDNVGYFEMLSHDLDALEVQRLENIAMRQPSKIKKYLFLLFGCMLIMYLTILGVYAFTMAT